MAAYVLTTHLAFSFWDKTNQRYGLYTDPKDLLELGLQNPEQNVIKNVSSAPTETFGQTLDSYPVPSGSSSMTARTRALADHAKTPTEMELFKAAFSASAEAFSQSAGADNYFSAYIDALERNIDSGKRNLNASASIVHKEASPATGTATGTATSGTGTTLVDSGQSWTDDDLIGAAVMVYAGTGAGQIEAITDNDGTSVTVASWSVDTPDATSKYAIVTSATAMVKDTDYAVDALNGMIQPLSGGSFSAGDTAHGFVTCYAITGATQLNGGAETSIQFRAKGTVKDVKSGKKGYITIPQATAYSSANQQLVQNAESPAFNELTLTADIEVADGETYPFTITWDETHAAA